MSLLRNFEEIDLRFEQLSRKIDYVKKTLFKREMENKVLREAVNLALKHIDVLPDDVVERLNRSVIYVPGSAAWESWNKRA